VPADATALFVSGQVIAVDQRLHRRNRRREACRGLLGQEFGQEKERALLDERAP
jgi:hypothetical protein